MFDKARSWGRAAATTTLILMTPVFANVVATDSSAPAPTAEDRAWLLGTPPQPEDNPSTPAKVELGRTLFFDPRLSGDGTVACASCHNPGLGWSDGLKTGSGIGGHKLGRATPTIVSTAFNTQFMWDGRKKSLEDQALGPMKTAEEMGTDFKVVFARLEAIEGYRKMFAAAFPGQAIGEDTLAKAIASFERTVVSNDSRFDLWLAGDRSALTVAEWRGYQVFKDPERGNCAACHSGPNMTDNGYHNIGVGGEVDDGRFAIRKLPSMKGAFKTPTLRDVALTAPYFHNGTATTLMEVVDHYARGGDQHPANLAPEVHPLALSDRDKEDLVAFMKSLTGEQHPLTLPALPQ